MLCWNVAAYPSDTPEKGHLSLIQLSLKWQMMTSPSNASLFKMVEEMVEKMNHFVRVFQLTDLLKCIKILYNNK